MPVNIIAPRMFAVTGNWVERTKEACAPLESCILLLSSKFPSVSKKVTGAITLALGFSKATPVETPLVLSNNNTCFSVGICKGTTASCPLGS